jgi:hypothetical protein
VRYEQGRKSEDHVQYIILRRRDKFTALRVVKKFFENCTKKKRSRNNSLETREAQKALERGTRGKFSRKNGFLQHEGAAKSKRGQDTKGVWWMPWYQEAKKDVASDEMLRGAASEHRAVDIRMGQPSRGEPLLSLPEYIG